MVMGGHTADRRLRGHARGAASRIDQRRDQGPERDLGGRCARQLALGELPSIVTLDVDRRAGADRVAPLGQRSRPSARSIRTPSRSRSRSASPIAVWQRAAAFALIEQGGRRDQQPGRTRATPSLPMVVGEGRRPRAPTEFVALMDEFPSLKPRVKAGVLVSDRRWNVVLVERRRDHAAGGGSAEAR